MIKIEGLYKKFGSLQVLNNLSLTISEGQATGIVGPNGSGKTTLIKHLLGLVKADSGTIYINGTKLNGAYEYRRHIGYMPQMAQYPENMKLWELIDFIIKIRDQKPFFKDELMELFELEKELYKPLRVLSGGTKQKAGALVALMFDPEILILDEPSAGLDPKTSYRFKKWIKREKERGKTILLTTHIMSEIEELSDYLVLLVEGKVRYHGKQTDFIHHHQEERLEGAVAKILEESAV